MGTALSFDEQVKQLVQVTKALGAGSPRPQQLEELLRLAKGIPPRFFPQDYPQVLATVFKVPLMDVQKHFVDPKRAILSDDFDALVPQGGWLYDYIEYTRQTEPPTVFHFFAGLCVLGATLARRRYIARGSGSLYPNLNCVLVAPAGKCKKTTACNIAVKLFRKIGGEVLADKATPEALVECFKAKASATGLIYAPEWAVFLGKEQYMQGMVALLTAWFDCPDTWSTATIMRGNPVLNNLGISHLACSTADWIQSNMPPEMMNGGFMSRLLFVVQEDTPRKFPDPPLLDQGLEKKLLDHLIAMQHIVGVVTRTPEAQAWWVEWYMTRKAGSVEKQFAGYLERKPDRLLQMSILLSVARDPRTLVVHEEDLRLAEQILGWIERPLPATFSELSASQTGDDVSKMLKQIRHRGGEIPHNEWVRANRTRMSADQFRKNVQTLIQGGQVAVDPVTKVYYLLAAGWSE